ncbi:MAG: LPS assembly protein LptD [Gammaproteobacteria bacterium]|nr:LPS assembly protein LptD [Gammaproteobacteria bacterium]
MKCLAVPVLAVALASPCAGAVSAVDAHWVPRGELDSAHLSVMPAHCSGMYLERDFPLPLDARADSYPARLRGDRLEYTRDGSVAFTGAVSFEQGNRRIAGERALVREVGATREVSFPKGLLFTEPGLALAGSSATFGMSGERVRVEDVDFVLFGPEFRGVAAAVDRRDDRLTVEGTRLTRCEPGDDAWRVESARIEVRKDAAFARARNVVVKLRGVPVFYSPWLRIPVSDDRQSGFLFPSPDYSFDEGLDLATPFYLNLAPNYDATLTPRLVSARGSGLTTEFRHLNAFAETGVVGAVLAEDRQYRTDTGISSSRWLSRVSHRGAFGGFTTFVDYAAVSDRDYFRDLGTDQDLVGQGHLRRFAEIRYTDGGLSAGLSAQAFQMLELRPEPHRRVPALDLTYSGRVLGALGWTVGAFWTAFDPPGDSSGGAPRVSGERAHVESRLQLPFLRSWGSLRLGAGYRYTSYALEDARAGTDTTPERAIAFADLDGSLNFDRDVGDGDVWTLEPRGYYLYQGYEAQHALPLFDTSFTTFSYPRLFRRDRFSGLDRIGDANQLTIGVTSRLLDGRTGRERLRASVGRILFFEDQRVALRGPATLDPERSASAFAAEAAARIGRLTVRGGGVWDPEHGDGEEFVFSLRYRSGNDRILNLARRARRDSDMDQGEVSAIWPLSDRWSAIGKWNYDVENARSNEIIAGFGYASCCWQARLLYRRLIEPAPGGTPGEVESDEGVAVQFVLRGLAGVGGRVESLLSRGIPGYREESLSGPLATLR